MNEKHPHRRLRFGLKTLFVLIGVLGVWLGWMTNEVRERRAALAELRARGVRIVTASQWSSASAGTGHTVPTIPLIRRWLGDEAIRSIGFYPQQRPSEAERDRLEKLFPEAAFEYLGPINLEVLPPEGPGLHRWDTAT